MRETVQTTYPTCQPKLNPVGRFRVFLFFQLLLSLSNLSSILLFLRCQINPLSVRSGSFWVVRIILIPAHPSFVVLSLPVTRSFKFTFVPRRP